MPQKSRERRPLHISKRSEIDSIDSDDEFVPKNKRRSIRFSSTWPCFAVPVGCCLFYMAVLLESGLPKVVTVEESGINSPVFSGERSEKILHRLASVGVKIVGSRENEVIVPDILSNELLKIKNISHPNQNFEYELQKGSGSYFLRFDPPFTNVYDNVQNVIAIVKGTNGSKSILLNCHYDSAPTSSGASDDGISCSAMIEVLRAIVTSPRRYEHNIVFLFNGAEESPLQGAHLFLQHKWAKGCTVVINLEAAGLGGRAVLFQSGPNKPWLMKYYSESIPHPFATVAAEEVFQSGAIPSDTDFRVFRDFGNMSGYDFAFYKNGYVYHTNYDDEKYIPTGCHQFLGDNILSLVKSLGNANELYEEEHEGKVSKMVFFDFLGLFLIHYSSETATYINFGTIILSAFSIFLYMKRYPKVTLYEMTIAIFSRLFGMLCGFSACTSMAFFIDKSHSLTMPWFSNTWLIFPLYWCPCVLLYSLGSQMIDSRRMKKGYSPISMCQLSVISYQYITTMALLLFMSANLRSAYIPMVAVLFPALANFIIYSTSLHQNFRKWVTFYIVMNIPSLLLAFQSISMLYNVFIPMLGRSGYISGDLVVGISSSVFVIYSLSFIIPILLHGVKKPNLYLFFLFGLTVIGISLSLFTTLGDPYSDHPDSPAPQRFWIMHTERKFYNADNTLRKHDYGYFMLNYDMNSKRTVSVQNLVMNDVSQNCTTEMYCGIPLYSGRMVNIGANGNWIPSTPPNIPEETQLKIEKKSCTKTLDCTLDLSLTGPDRMTVIFSPRLGINLTSWTFSNKPEPSGIFNNQPLYHIHITRGEIKNSFNLSLTFKVIDAFSPIADISLTGNFVHHDKFRSKHYNKFLSDFPSYAHIIAWISSFNVYVI